MKIGFLSNFHHKITILLTVSLFTSGCIKSEFEQYLNWVYEAPRDIPWSGYGGSTTPVDAGEYIIYTGGYFWQNQVYMYVVNKKTGKLVWKNDDSTYQFKIAKDKVVISTRESIHRKGPGKSRLSKIICYELDSGKKLWEQKVSISGNEPNIIAAQTFVYVWIPGKELTCLDLKTGSIEWRRFKNLENTRMANATVTADGDKLYLAEPDKVVILIDGTKGKFEKAYSIKGLAPKSYFPKLQLTEDNLFLFGSTGFLTIIDLKNNNISLNRPMGIIKERISLENGKLYYTKRTNKNRHDEDEEYSLCCFDLDNRKSIWSKKLAEGHFSACLLGNDLLYLGDRKTDENFFAINKETGKLTWEKKIGPISGDPVYKDGIVYVCGKEYFFALDSKSGNEVWKMKPKQYVPTASPLITNDSIYFVGKDAYLYSFEPAKSKAFSPASKKKSSQMEVEKENR